MILLHEDAGGVLKRAADASIDLAFLDSERPEYPVWCPDLKRRLRPGGLPVVGNRTS
jgi:predicted O-methyltransferase YrrM